MNSIDRLKDAFSHLFKGNFGRAFVFFYLFLFLLLKDGFMLVLEWIKATANAPGKQKALGLLPLALLYLSYHFL